MTTWHVRLEGGGYDGWKGWTELDLGPVLIAWKCPGDPACKGHMTLEVNDPGIVLATAVAYRLWETIEGDASERDDVAIYRVGEQSPEDGETLEAELELVHAVDGFVRKLAWPMPGAPA